MVNQGRKRAKDRRKSARRKERKKAATFGTFVEKNNQVRFSLD